MKESKISRHLILVTIVLGLCVATMPARAQSTKTFTEWAVPTSSNCPFGLVAASRNLIYFTEAPCAGTAAIGGLDTRTNTVTEWTGSGLVSPQGVVVLGRFILFADQIAGTVKMLNAFTNQLTTWALPTLGSGPLRVVALGADIFFTEQAGRIGMLNPFTNQITEWTVPGGNHTPLGIAADPEGENIWFSQATGAQLGALDLSDNSFRQWTIPSTILPSPFIQGIALPEGDHLFFGTPDSVVGELDASANVLTAWTTPVHSAPTQFLAQELDGNWRGEESFEVHFTDPVQDSIWSLLTAKQAGTSSTIPVTTTSVTPSVTTVTPTITTLTQTSAVVTPTTTNVAGVITGGFEHWVIPSPGSDDYAIAKLPGGGLAFTEANGNKIATLR